MIHGFKMTNVERALLARAQQDANEIEAEAVRTGQAIIRDCVKFLAIERRLPLPTGPVTLEDGHLQWELPDPVAPSPIKPEIAAVPVELPTPVNPAGV